MSDRFRARSLNLFEVAHDLAERLIGTFVRDARPPAGLSAAREKFQTDPHWRDHLLFYEYFHGDNGAGIGASHQTGWTGCIASIIQVNGALTEDMLSVRGLETVASVLGASGQAVNKAQGNT